MRTNFLLYLLPALCLFFPRTVAAENYGSDTAVEWSMPADMIQGGSTVTLDGVTVTLGSADITWTNGLPTKMVNIDGTGITTFTTSNQLPTSGAYLIINPTKNGTISITGTEASSNRNQSVIFATVEESTVTNVQTISNAKGERTHSFTVEQGKTYYFFQLATAAGTIKNSRYTLKSLAFAEAKDVHPQDISTYSVWNFIEEAGTWKANTVPDVYENLAVTGSVTFEESNGRYKIAQNADGAFAFNVTSDGYLSINGKATTTGVKVTVGGEEANVMRSSSGMVYSRKVTGASAESPVAVKISGTSNDASIFYISWIPAGSPQCGNTQSAQLDDKGFATYCACFGVNIPDGVKAYYMSAAPADGTLSFTELKGTLPPNVAVVLVGTPGANVTFTEADEVSTGKAETAYSYNSAASSAQSYLHYAYKADGNQLPGASGTKTYYAYKKGTGKFVRVAADITLPYGKAYFSLDKTANAAEVQSFRLDVNGGVTSAEVTEAPVVANDVWYTVSGVRVSKPAKGLYIHNGKAVMVNE